MILDLDIGNSYLKWQLASCDTVSAMNSCPLDNLTSISGALANLAIDKICIAASLNKGLENILKQIKEITHCDNIVYAASAQQQLGVTNAYARWQDLGVDRWLAMLAAFNKCQNTCMIIDCGSAVTIDQIDTSGQHLGGYIVPSVAAIVQSLSASVALDVVESESTINVLGASTKDAIVGGSNTMLVNFITQQLALLKVNYPQAHIYLTGGGAAAVAPYLTADVLLIDDLVLQGLRLVMS
jgi:type III pantothenate kinase